MCLSGFSPVRFQPPVEGGGVPGDASGDGLANIDDVVMVVTSWGECDAGLAACPADLTGDGWVGIDDVVEVVLHWTG